MVEYGLVGAVLQNVTVAGWSPQPSWRVGFGARTGGTLHDYHMLDNVRIRAGSAFRKQLVSLEVSANAQEQTDDAVGFSYYAEPTVSELRFDRGPVAGGTSACGHSSIT